SNFGTQRKKYFFSTRRKRKIMQTAFDKRVGFVAQMEIQCRYIDTQSRNFYRTAAPVRKRNAETDGQVFLHFHLQRNLERGAIVEMRTQHIVTRIRLTVIRVGNPTGAL